ncbi:MAG: hypothetical protein KC502_12190 [Myxococcales bacterium]|nr:hypothetical protein [Myxococcales bacterium]
MGATLAAPVTGGSVDPTAPKVAHLWHERARLDDPKVGEQAREPVADGVMEASQALDLVELQALVPARTPKR